LRVGPKDRARIAACVLQDAKGSVVDGGWPVESGVRVGRIGRQSGLIFGGVGGGGWPVFTRCEIGLRLWFGGRVKTGSALGAGR
jgi:hypothetical protein